MASTYVNDLRLNEMATGDASGSWGTVTNTNLELIGEAFSYGTETIGDADSTLTIADGAADAARSFYLKITSSVDLTTTRIVTLAPNTVSKVWMIENATTGSQVITIKQGSGATINVPNGQVKMISTDGAGSGGAVLDLLVDVDLTGTTTLVNLDVSGTLGVTGVLTATSLDISGDIDVDGTTNLDVVDIDGATQIDATVTVGVDDTGYDVKFFGDTASAYMLWDASADDLILGGAAGLSVNSAALVTGVLTTTAATVSNGGGQFNGAINVGVDDTGYDVKFFGATAGAYMLWDESADDLILGGAAGLSVNSTALVTGVLTTTAATVHTGGITMPDNAKAIFGAGSDLQIYHDGTHSYIKDAGTGSLILQGTTGVYITDAPGNQNLLSAIADGAVTLYYDDAAKLATTATGIDVTGAAAFTGGISIDGQNASTPGLSEKSDLDTGIFWPAANTIAVSTAGTERMRIDSVGGLITTPEAGGHAVFNEDAIDADFRVESDANDHMLFVDGGNNRVSINSNSTSYDSAAPLHIGNNSTYSYGPNIQGAVNRTYVHYIGSGGGSGNNVYIHGYQVDNPAGGNYLRVAGGLAGNAVSGVQQSQDGIICVYDTGKTTGDADYTPTIQHRIDFNSGGSVVFNDQGLDLDFRVASDNDANALFIEGSSGEVMFGKNTVSASTVGVAFRGVTGESFFSISTGNTLHVYDTVTPAYRFYVSVNGGISNYSANNVNLSDEREKKNIEDLPSQWDCLKHWDLKQFHYNADDDALPKKYGVIAQEIEAHCPEVIDVFKVNDDTERMGVKEQQMMWMAIKALQEAQTRIESLEARITALEL
jgi:hypothetical protein